MPTVRRAKEPDPHISCFDAFHLDPVVAPHRRSGPLEALCDIPAEEDSTPLTPTVQLLPGIEVFDLFEDSELSTVWKDGEICQCLVPQSVLGWEFFSLLWPQPDGAAPVRLNADVEVLFGRPPGLARCPSLLFAYVPAGRAYEGPGDLLATQPGHSPHQGRSLPLGRAGRSRRGGGAMRSAHASEKASHNLDHEGRSCAARLTVLSPTAVYKDANALPEVSDAFSSSWGLFIGPRSRSLVLLSRQRGRIDLHLAMLFSVDAAFRQGGDLIAATARLYAPFGTEEQAAALLGGLDPSKVHCGVTNALVADHVDASTDGRGDYREYLGCILPNFFVSNASNNLLFLTPHEAQQHRGGCADARGAPGAPSAKKLPDFPMWTSTGGAIEEDQRNILRKYHAQFPPRMMPARSLGDELLNLLGLNDGGPSSWTNVVNHLGGCADVRLAGAREAIAGGGGGGGARPHTRGGVGSAAGGSNLQSHVPSRPVSAGESDHHVDAVGWQLTQHLVPGGDELPGAPIIQRVNTPPMPLAAPTSEREPLGA